MVPVPPTGRIVQPRGADRGASLVSMRPAWVRGSAASARASTARSAARRQAAEARRTRGGPAGAALDYVEKLIATFREGRRAGNSRTE